MSVDLRSTYAFVCGYLAGKSNQRHIDRCDRAPRIGLFEQCALSGRIILLSLLLVPSSGAQMPFTQIVVKVSGQRDLSAVWEVQQAGLEETISGTKGYLDLVNRSAGSITDTTFYGEYFDSSGRFCFSLVFSQASNLGSRGPIGPGEARRFESVAAELFAASEPTQLKLYLVGQPSAQLPNAPVNWDVPATAPVTVIGSLGFDQSQVQIDPEAESADRPVRDLVIAEVSVDQSGRAGQVNFLNDVSWQARNWFLPFVHDELRFYPASDWNGFRSDRVLVLVRAIISENGPEDMVVPPRMSLCVKSYVDGLSGNRIPPITEIVLTRPRAKVKLMGSGQLIERPAAPPGLFKVSVWNSDWSSVFNWVGDPSMPYRLRRQLTADKP